MTFYEKYYSVYMQISDWDVDYNFVASYGITKLLYFK